MQTPQRKLKPKPRPRPKPRKPPKTEAEKEKARKRVRLIRRIILLTLFIGFMGIFLYNNRDYFMPALDNYSIHDLLPKKDAAAEAIKAIKKAEADSIKAYKKDIAEKIKTAKIAEADSIRAVKAVRIIEEEKIKAEKIAEAERIKTAKMAEAERAKAIKAAEADSIRVVKAAKIVEAERIKAEKTAEVENIKTDKTTETERIKVKKEDWTDKLAGIWSETVNTVKDMKVFEADSAKVVKKAEVEKAKADKAERKRVEKLRAKNPEAPKESKTARNIDEVLGERVFADSVSPPLKPEPVKTAESEQTSKNAPLWAIAEPAPYTEPEPVLPTKPEPAKPVKAEPVQPAKPEPVEIAKKESPVSVPAEPTEETFYLSDIRCKLADRDDLTIYLTAELIFNGEPIRREIIFKRGALTAVAGNVVRGHEYGNVSTAKISRDLLTAFNGILLAGDLNRVDVKDFRVEPNQ